MFLTTLAITLPILLASPESVEQAKELYRKGSTLYEAADYEGAIRHFTEALNLIGPDEEAYDTRMLLLFNIASAYEKQYSIDNKKSRLKQALALYQRYKAFSRKKGNLGEELDVEARIARVQQLLAQDHTPPPKKTTKPLQLPQGDKEKRPTKKPVGTALVTTGSFLTLGGLALIIVGSQLRGRAIAQVDKLNRLNLPPEHPAWEQGQEFIDQESKKGRILLGTGIAAGAVGAVTTGIGISFFTKKKSAPKISIRPVLSPKNMGLSISGKF